ncbi:DUF4276 family protein [Achromobacter ruhlandii]|uniref:DUF4276 family protein n=1 Tax=Achromobacter ruhlandii TaxID=72557 RepID=UPI000C25F9EF|nr:DUF4276 family protein [Achromobacter ruhlandii]PJM89065.1 hypothetical protein CV044_12120 [Achromobacter ruhlandii]
MATFALITEGITDQIALDAILAGHYQSDDIFIRELQPLRDETDKARQNSSGGWEQVLEYCRHTNNITDALQFSDFIIIQFDTDCIEHKNFDVKLTTSGVEKPEEQLIEEVKARIIKEIDADCFEKNKEKIFFAISIHSLECWIIPLHEKNSQKATQTKKCEDRLRYIHNQNKPQEKYSKTAGVYKKITKKFEKKDHISSACEASISFNYFIKSLPAIAEE